MLPTPTKMTSHLGLQQVIDGSISFRSYFANGLADVAAEALTPRLSPSSNTVADAGREEQIGVHIAMWLAVIEWLSWQCLHNSTSIEVTLGPILEVSTPAVHAARLWEKLQASGHDLASSQQSKGGCLTRCKIYGHSTRTQKLDFWLQTPCAPCAIISKTSEVVDAWEPSLRSPPHEEQADVAHAARVVRGSLGVIKQLSRKHSEASKASAKFEAASKSQARTLVENAVRKSLSGPDDIESAAQLVPDAPAGSFIIPAWCRTIHPSHIEIKTAGGAVFCTPCGALATTSRRGRLQEMCDAACKSPDRLKYLLQGRACGVAEWDCWPNGAAKKLTLLVYRISRDVISQIPPDGLSHPTDDRKAKSSQTITASAPSRR